MLFGGFAPTILLRKFSAHVPAVLYLIHESTKEILSSSVLYLSDSVVKKKALKDELLGFCFVT